MAPRKQAPVKVLIDVLFDKLGVQPFPTIQTIRTEVGEIRKRYVGIEDVAGAPDLSAQNECLKTELDAKEKALEVKNKELEDVKSEAKSQIDILRTELDALRAEHAKGKKKDDELPDDQFTILKIVPPESTHKGRLVSEIHSKTKMSIGDVGVHVSHLKKEGYIAERQTGLYRTNKGHSYLMAKRLAEESGEDEAGWLRILSFLTGAHGGRSTLEIERLLKIPRAKLEYLLCELENEALVVEIWEHGYRTDRVGITTAGSHYFTDRGNRLAEEDAKPAYTDPDLPENEERMLIRIHENGGHWLVPYGENESSLSALQKVGMVDHHPDRTSTYGQGTHWFITGVGQRYLTERRLGEE